jgi:hypothetical protein
MTASHQLAPSRGRYQEDLTEAFAVIPNHAEVLADLSYHTEVLADL